MSDEKKTPAYVAYSVRDRGPDKDAAWTRVGAAWEHRDGKGLDLQLEATPVDGRVTMREQRKEDYRANRAEAPDPKRTQEREW